MDNYTHNNSEKLVRYLDGELGDGEKAALEQQLAADTALQAELNSLKSTSEAVKLYGLQQMVSGIHVQMMEDMQPPVKRIIPARNIFRYSIAVAASLILLVGGYMAYNFFTLSPDKVFASRYQPYELVTVRDGNTNETPAEKAYREKNYNEVLRIYDTGEDHTPKGEFLCGAAALEMKDNNKAIKCFKEVLDANKQAQQTILNDEAEYYLSLSYIRNKDYDYALDMLNKILDDPGHLYNEKITSKLIRQVKMLKWR
jgi:tetratricopeptide (TPR) repeat protein